MATLRARNYGNEAGTASSSFRVVVELYSEDNNSNGHKIWVQRYIQVTKGNFRGTIISTSWGGSVSVSGVGNYAVSGLVYVGVQGYGGTTTQSGSAQYIASNVVRRSSVSASWTAPRPTHTVTYDANGGIGAPQSQTKTYGYVLTLSGTIPKKDGYMFLGWNKNKNATTVQYYAGDYYGADANITLYAVWQKIQYLINFSSINADAVVYDGKEYTDYYRRLVDYREPIGSAGAMPVARKRNYKFTGWNTRLDGYGLIVTKDTQAEEDMILYPMFELQTNCYVKKNGKYESAMMYIKEESAYKTGTVSVRDNGKYKESGI